MSDSKFLAGLAPGVVAWAYLEPVQGREQGGRRPVVVISSAEYLELVTTLVAVIPVTTNYRGWDNHVSLSGDTGLNQPSWAMTEQIRTISRSRITQITGKTDEKCLRECKQWIRDFFDLY